MRVFFCHFPRWPRLERLPIPCIARSSEPYRLALDHLSDVTRDVSHAPRVIQFRMEMRAAAAWISARLPRFAAPFGSGLLAQPFRAAFYFWEIIFISAILQLGMLPPLAYYFHRVTLAGPFANVPALLLTGLAVPIGFLTLAASLVSHALAGWLCETSGTHSRDAGRIRAMVRGLARRELPHSGTVRCSHGDLCRASRLRYPPPFACDGKSGGVSSAAIALAGRGRRHRDASLSAASLAAASGIDGARRGPGRQPFSFLPARAHHAGRWRRRTRNFSFGRHALRD